MRSNGGRFAAILVALAIFGVACSSSPSGTPSSGPASPSGGGSETPSVGGTTTIGGESANNHGSATVTGKSSIEVEQDNFYFDPTILTGSAGQSLTIELKNEGSVPHTFTIDGTNIDVTLNPGDSKKVKVTFPDSGFTVFYCRFHRTQGMLGELATA